MTEIESLVTIGLKAVLPIVLVLLTLISYTTLIQKLTENLEKIVLALKDFLSFFVRPRIKISLTIITTLYLVIEALIVFGILK